MIRTTAAPRTTARLAGTAVVGIAGAIALAGCAGTGTTGDGGTDAGGSTTYADGTYTADGSYQTPETVESIEVTVTLADGVITDVEVTGDPQRPETEQYQGQFIGGISDEVVGKEIDSLSVSRVAGSSLTSGGFNAAIDAIQSQAQS